METVNQLLPTTENTQAMLSGIGPFYTLNGSDFFRMLPGATVGSGRKTVTLSAAQLAALPQEIIPSPASGLAQIPSRISLELLFDSAPFDVDASSKLILGCPTSPGAVAWGAVLLSASGCLDAESNQSFLLEPVDYVDPAAAQSSQLISGAYSGGDSELRIAVDYSVVAM